MKRILTLAGCLFALMFSNASFAGIPVIDGANLAQALLQVQSWAQQYEQMASQISQLETQYKAISGVRNLGDIINNPALENVVPTDVSNVFRAIQQGGAGGLTSAAQALRQSQAVYNCNDRVGADLQTCQAYLVSNAQKTVNAETGLDQLQQRWKQIQDLMNQINTTQDPKGIAELQARLQVEQASVANDASRINLMNTLADAQAKAAEQTIHEQSMQAMSRTSDGTDTFVYQPRY